MKQLVQYETIDDHGQTSSIFVEIQVPSDGTVRVGTSGVEKSADTFQGALEKVKPALQTIVKVLNDINNPDEIEVEVGLKLTGKAGCVLASLDNEVNFKVTLKWRKEK